MEFNRLISISALCLGILLMSNTMAETSLGTGTGALLGGDMTDPENDGVDGSATFAGFDWVSIVSSNEPSFSAEGSYNIFDNNVGAGSAKWCCDTPAPIHTVAVEFANQYELTHFTIASGNDTPGRDPDIWHIDGSNDGITWTPIYTYNNDGVSPFASRLEVLRYDGAGADFATPPLYSWFRYRVESTVSGGHQINEIEFFGNKFITPVPTLSAWSILLLSLFLGIIILWNKPKSLFRRD